MSNPIEDFFYVTTDYGYIIGIYDDIEQAINAAKAEKGLLRAFHRSNSASKFVETFSKSYIEGEEDFNDNELLDGYEVFGITSEGAGAEFFTTEQKAIEAAAMLYPETLFSYKYSKDTHGYEADKWEMIS